MPNTNFQTIHQMGSAISNVVKQATGRDPVENIDMDYVTVAQNRTRGEMIITGNPAEFHTGNSVPIQRLLLGFAPAQNLHGQSSPYPAGGGKNKLRNDAQTTTLNGVTFTVYEDGSVNVNGTASELTIFTILNLKATDYQLENGNYILSGSPPNSDTTKWKFRMYYGSADIIDSGSGANVTYYGYAETSTCKVDIVVYPDTVMNNVKIYPMLRLNTVSDATFAPYSNICPITGRTGANVTANGTTIPITFPDPPGTVYSGTLNLITGELIVDRYLTRPTFGSSLWFSGEGTDWYATYVSPHPAKKQGADTAICSHFVAETTDANNRITLKNTGFSTRAGIQQYAQEQQTAGTPIQILYILATPVTYQLTPQELNTIAGDNVISTDADTLEVMYYQWGEVI